jgi:hypothetical protein
MIKKVLRSAVLATAAILALGTVGCRGSPCERGEEISKDKQGTCAGGNSSTETLEQCEQRLEKCTSDDTKKLHSFLDCYEDVPACEAGKEEEHGKAFVGCAGRLQGISQACLGTE